MPVEKEERVVRFSKNKEENLVEKTQYQEKNYCCTN